jgi:hypothetical protein
MGTIVYVDVSRVRPGNIDDLKAGMEALASFVEEHEPDIPCYDVFFNADGTEMTVTHVHADPATLDFHMEIAGPEFAKVRDFIDLVSIDVYGEPSEQAIAGMRRKAEMLGQGVVRIHSHHAGLCRISV